MDVCCRQYAHNDYKMANLSMTYKDYDNKNQHSLYEIIANLYNECLQKKKSMDPEALALQFLQYVSICLSVNAELPTVTGTIVDEIVYQHILDYIQ